MDYRKISSISGGYWSSRGSSLLVVSSLCWMTVKDTIINTIFWDNSLQKVSCKHHNSYCAHNCMHMIAQIW